MARLCGASQVIVVGLADDQQRLEAGRQLGADLVLCIGDRDPVEVVDAFTAGRGADLVIDSAGDSRALRAALGCVRPMGQITKIGWGPAPVGLSIDPLIQKAATLRGSFSHSWPMWERCLRLMKHGQLQPQLLATTVPLSAWMEGISMVERRQAVKVLLSIKPDIDPPI
jgi:alcohol dehydrogenase/L-iditol 2-dehydrogenase